MAETFTPKSPRPTRAQIAAVFKDPDFAKKVEKIFDDLINAAEAANANAAEIEEIHEQTDTLSAIVTRAMEFAIRAEALAEANELLSGAFNQLRARMTCLERSISDLEQAPL